MRNPARQIDIEGPLTVRDLLARLELNREAHLVVCDGELVPGDRMLADGSEVEIRSVISGGAGPSDIAGRRMPATSGDSVRSGCAEQRPRGSSVAAGDSVRSASSGERP